MAVIGVSVIAGFLGSGKTTLLRRIVQDERIGSRIAVIINELGALGLDEELVRSEKTTATMQMRQLVSGCICCTLRGDLLDALQELATGRDRAPPQHILIETSGAARASELSYAINAIGFEAPFRTDSVLTLVDAQNARRAYREHKALFTDQVRAADVVLLNKGDLVRDEQERATLRAWIATLAPRATVVWTVNADVDPGHLIGAWPAHVELAADRGSDHRDPPQEQIGAHGLASLSLPLPRPLCRDILEGVLEDLADRIFRIKGVVDVREGEIISPTLIQVVGDRIEMDAIAPNSPLLHSRRRLIFIGADLDEGFLQKAFTRAEEFR